MTVRFSGRIGARSGAVGSCALATLLLVSCSNSPTQVRDVEPHRWSSVPTPEQDTHGFHPPAPATPASVDEPSIPPLPFVAGSSTLVVMPDTQVYAERYPSLFEAQTRWIAEHVHDRNIVFALHLGDVTEHNTKQQWRVAQRAFSWLDGVVPYGIAVGNHDCGERGAADRRDSLLSDFFPVRHFKAVPSFAGTFEKDVLDNSVHTFSAGGRGWVSLFLEWAPRDAAVDWGNHMLRAHSDRIGIVVTHAYLYSDDTRFARARTDQSWAPHAYDTDKLEGGANDGEQLWTRMVRHHANLGLVLSGHVLGKGTGRLSSPGDRGNTVHQLLSNYQMMQRGGEGYLRLIEVLPDGRTLQVKTYSPVLDSYMTTLDHQFTLTLDVQLTHDADPFPRSSPIAERSAEPREGTIAPASG